MVLAFLNSGRKFIQGGHQGAKKSMMTGCPLVIMSGKSEKKKSYVDKYYENGNL